jgi:hypothetical protein
MLLGHSMPEGFESRIRLPPQAQGRLDGLQAMLHQYCASDLPNLTTCSEALRALREIYRNIIYFYNHERGVQVGQVFRWTSMVPIEYVKLVQSQYPPALVIMAHFAAATGAVKLAWYTTNWGIYAVQGVAMALEPGLQHWLEWPREQLQSGLPAVVPGPDSVTTPGT